MRIFDTHSHYDDEAYREDRGELISRIHEAGVEHMVNIGASMDSSRRTVELLREYPFFYGAIGVHPDEITNLTEADMQWLLEHAKDERVVAIGEIGLDYYWHTDNKEAQRRWFCRQIEVAKEAKLPIVVHSREATEETLRIIRETNASQVGGVIHCFSGSKEVAAEYVKLGFYIGVGGVVTFKNGRVLKEVVEATPLTSIVTETDCPYLAPVPHRGSRNDSSNITYIIEEIAALKGMSAEEVAPILYENALRLYHLEGE